MPENDVDGVLFWLYFIQICGMLSFIYYSFQDTLTFSLISQFYGFYLVMFLVLRDCKRKCKFQVIITKEIKSPSKVAFTFLQMFVTSQLLARVPLWQISTTAGNKATQFYIEEVDKISWGKHVWKTKYKMNENENEARTSLTTFLQIINTNQLKTKMLFLIFVPLENCCFTTTNEIVNANLVGTKRIS